MSKPQRRSPVAKNSWSGLREFTNARIALGHAGESLPTEALLSFQLDHARARDAVHSALDFTRLASEVSALGFFPLALKSRAESRDQYLRNPSLGRRLAPESEKKWKTGKRAQAGEILMVLGDGLSALAMQTNGIKLFAAIAGQIGKSLAKEVPLISNARVAIGDELAALANAKLVLLLIGERPGLSTAENISVYLTFQPKVGTTDEARNCISNIGGPGGLSIELGAVKAVYLARKALQEGRSGLLLKDEQFLLSVT